LAKIDHLGIAVRSIAAARGVYEALGLTVFHPQEDALEQVFTAMIPLGESSIVLLEPTSADSPVGRFLEQRGEGLHHVALHVQDISGTLEALKAKGARLVSEEIQTGMDGHLYFFIHPESAGGVLVEICQDEITGV
jgi:methylmalonyl-CoA epimerase